jgi:hypothetical protein
VPEKLDFKRCSECLEIVPYRVKICPNCKSYQDWRRYAAIGQTNLALLVALFSVLATLATVGAPFFYSRGAAISVLLQSSDKTSLTFLARNDGQSGGVVTVIGFQVFLDYESSDKEWQSFMEQQTGAQVVAYSLADRGFYIQARREERFSLEARDLTGDVKTYIEENKLFEFATRKKTKAKGPLWFIGALNSFYKEARVKCEFFFREAGFYKDAGGSQKRVLVDCGNVAWFRAAMTSIAMSRPVPEE